MDRTLGVRRSIPADTLHKDEAMMRKVISAAIRLPLPPSYNIDNLG